MKSLSNGKGNCMSDAALGHQINKFLCPNFTLKSSSGKIDIRIFRQLPGTAFAPGWMP